MWAKESYETTQDALVGEGLATAVNTFGVGLTRDEHDDDLGGFRRAAERLGSPTPSDVERLDEIDRMLAVWSKRWRWDSRSASLIGSAARIEPGDICAVRANLNREMRFQFDAAVMRRRADEAAGDSSLIFSRDAEICNRPIQQVMVAATICFMPNTAAWSAMASRPLCSDDRDDLRLDAATVVLFDTPMEIPSGDLVLDGSRIDPAYGDVPALHRQPVVDLLTHGGGDHYGWRLAGVVLLGDSAGLLADSVVWLCHKESDWPLREMHRLADNAFTCTAVGTVTGYGLVLGSLQRSVLAPIAEALAAMVSWGSWSESSVETAQALESLEASRKTSAFRKAYRRGHISGVRVVQMRPGNSPPARSNSSTGRTSPRSHFRRGFWKRVRVGSESNWHYERRRIAPTIVNAGKTPMGELVRIYRLPSPNTDSQAKATV